MEVHVGNRVAEVELISKEDNKVTIKIDDKTYEVDIVMAENGSCSIITNNGRSYNAEFKRENGGKSYKVNTHFNTFPVDIIDQQAKYLMNRKKGESSEAQDRVFSPMPGKVVKILVEKGQEVKCGQSVIVVEAMKMQSEYKVKRDCIIKDILVNVGDVINGDQTLITLKDIPGTENA